MRYVVEGCWIAFGLVWVAGWVYNLRYSPAIRRRKSTLQLSLVVVALAFLFSALRRVGLSTPTFDFIWLRQAGVAIVVVSTAFTLWARFVLGTMWTARAVAHVGQELRTGGPYGITRHPIYTGVLGMLLGTALASGTGAWLIIFGIACLVLVLKARSEEQLLMETLGEAYREYRRRVPALVPFLHVTR